MKAAAPTPSPLVAEAHEQLDASLRRFVAARVPAVEVDDLVQEVYLRLARVNAEVEHLSGFVYRVARNTLAEFHRRHEIAVEEEPYVSEDAGVAAEVASWLAPMIRSLDEPYRSALELAELQSLSHVDAAARLGIPRSTFSSRVQKARVLLRERLTQCCAIELDARRRVTGYEPKPGCC